MAAVATETSDVGEERRRRRFAAVMRSEERVMPLELFFDLVFVLALTQCTALMADDPTWEGLAKGMLVLSLLWWAWVGYSWFTSVVDPEEGAIRLLIFGAMAAFLVAALCIPQAFSGLALEFAIAYGIVRYIQLGLFWVASADEPQLRRSIMTGLIGSSTVGVGLLIGASFLEGGAQLALWALALALDMAGPLFFGSEGWKLAPEHFAERHGLIVLIALGESIVAIGVGSEVGVDAGVVAAAVLGVATAAALWWLYFDVVAIAAGRRLAAASPGKEQNEMARDSYSFLHLALVGGIVMGALGFKKTLADVDDPLKVVTAFALLGGTALYLLGHVAFRWRNIHTLNRQRLLLAGVLLALLPVAAEIPSLATLTIVTALLVALIVFETHLYGEAREQVRRGTYTPGLPR
jgi:low temperature requirement protein LtrA